MRRRGFTLIEVLLVVAIFALLVALVLAASATVRERARQSVCESNLHQIGLAIQMYRADYDGIEPVIGAEIHAWQLGLPPPPLELLVGGKHPYIADRRILFCPDYAGQHGKLSSSTYQWPYERDFLGQEAFPLMQRWYYVCSQRGDEAVLVGDDNHNPAINPHVPRWNTKRVIVLRLSGNVKNEIVPIRTFWYDW